jgi:hypothetical protein
MLKSKFEKHTFAYSSKVSDREINEQTMAPIDLPLEATFYVGTVSASILPDGYMTLTCKCMQPLSLYSDFERQAGDRGHSADSQIFPS